jgi:hypothetical protein
MSKLDITYLNEYGHKAGVSIEESRRELSRRDFRYGMGLVEESGKCRISVHYPQKRHPQADRVS